MLDTVKINHVQHISFTQSRLTDAVSVILSELLSYEHPSNRDGGLFETVEKAAARRDTGRKIVTKETQEGCRSFLIIRSWNFFKVS